MTKQTNNLRLRERNIYKEIMIKSRSQFQLKFIRVLIFEKQVLVIYYLSKLFKSNW